MIQHDEGMRGLEQQMRINEEDIVLKQEENTRHLESKIEQLKLGSSKVNQLLKFS